MRHPIQSDDFADGPAARFVCRHALKVSRTFFINTTPHRDAASRILFEIALSLPHMAQPVFSDAGTSLPYTLDV